jgi:hypothetical protein
MHAEVLMTVICAWQVLQAPAPSDAEPENLEVRYARAQLQLAEANLHRVEQSNKQVKNSVPSSVVAEYQDDVTVARTRLDQAAAGKAAKDFQVWLARAEAEQRAAEATRKIALVVNVQLPGTFDPLDVERFRLRAEVAKLQYDQGRTLVDAGFEAQLQWKLDLLDNQVQRLKEESRRTKSFERSSPWWRW